MTKSCRLLVEIEEWYITDAQISPFLCFCPWLYRKLSLPGQLVTEMSSKWHLHLSDWHFKYISFNIYSLLWRHNERAGVSNHQFHDCLLKLLFRRRSKKTPKLHWKKTKKTSKRHWPLCMEFTVTAEFPGQRASNAENVSIWWRHHVTGPKLSIIPLPKVITNGAKLSAGTALTPVGVHGGSWGQHGAHLGIVGPSWALCWSHEPCYQGGFLERHI